MKKTIYLLLCIAGTVLPLAEFSPFLFKHGLDLSSFLPQLFVNPVSGFFGMDIIISSFTLWVFVYSEGTRLKMRHLWIYVVCNLVVGVSLGLPLFLLMRQSKLDQSANAL